MEGNLMQLLLLQAERCSDLKRFIHEKRYLSGDIVNEVITLMGNVVLCELLSEIKVANIFSLIADEASDVSHKSSCALPLVGWIVSFKSMKHHLNWYTFLRLTQRH